MNWNNRPQLQGTALSAIAAAPAGTTVEYDVTPAVTGDGAYSFAVRNASNNVFR